MLVINTIRGHSKAEFVQEAKAIAELAFPALIAQFTRVAVYIINALFLVRISDLKRAYSHDFPQNPP